MNSKLNYKKIIAGGLIIASIGLTTYLYLPKNKYNKKTILTSNKQSIAITFPVEELLSKNEQQIKDSYQHVITNYSSHLSPSEKVKMTLGQSQTIQNYNLK